MIISKTSPTQLETLEQKKIALTPYDDKRLWISINKSEPYGLNTPHILQMRYLKELLKIVQIGLKLV